MTTLERVGAWIAVAVFVFGAGVAWDKLNNRIDKVDEKIGAIQKTLGSTACNSILSRQMEAIDKNKASVRESLDGLSKQYGCGPQDTVVVVPDYGQENASMSANATGYDPRQLNAQLNAVDTQLKKD